MGKNENVDAAPLNGIVMPSVIDCDSRHSFKVSDIRDGGLIECKRCGQYMRAVEMESVGGKLRVASPSIHRTAKAAKIQTVCDRQIEAMKDSIEACRLVKTAMSSSEFSIVEFVRAVHACLLAVEKADGRSA